MKVFLDANILIDRFDRDRSFYEFSKLTYEYLIKNENIQLFTSCDLITTIYYINSKIDKQQALHNIRVINQTLKVVDFSNKEIEDTCTLMMEDSQYQDLEDTIQYIMAKTQQCDIIISNDKNFVSKDIQLITSEKFYNKYINKEDIK